MAGGTSHALLGACPKGRLKPGAPALLSRLDRTVTGRTARRDTGPRTTDSAVAEGSSVANWVVFEPVRLRLGGRFENPILEPDVVKSRAVTGNERAFFEFDAPVPCGGVRNNFAGITAGGQRRPDEVGK